MTFPTVRGAVIEVDARGTGGDADELYAYDGAFWYRVGPSDGHGWSSEQVARWGPARLVLAPVG